MHSTALDRIAETAMLNIEAQRRADQMADARDRAIVEAARRGITQKDIAIAAGMTRGRVAQIVAVARAAA